MEKYIILVCVLNVLKNVYTKDTVQVMLSQGELLGQIEKSLFKKHQFYAFKGIPYAKPPVGALRFKPSEPHEGWDNVYEAFDNKPTCIQYSSRMRNGEQFGISGSEDCLYISVFTPKLEASLPVIVFDYNDNFRTSFNGTNTYSPDFFMEENVIVVTIQHRLDLFGYLTTEDNVIPPNAGLKDFVLGLNWVKKNIDKFGGDSNRVTIMGTRGGAALAEILLYSEKAKDLFSGVILQSGTALETLFFDSHTKEIAFKLGQVLNITASDSESLLEGLQKLDAETIAKKKTDILDTEILEEYQLSAYPFSPVVEGDSDDAIIKSLPEHAKIINDVPIMIGMNSREGLDLVSHLIFQPNLLTDLSQDLLFVFPIRTGFRFNRKSKAYEEAIKEILNFYFEDGYFYDGNILEYAVYSGDMLQNYALNNAAIILSASLNSSVFYYVFDFRGQLNENSEYMTKYARFSMKHWGATIGDELCYLHVCTRIKSRYKELIKLVSEQPEIKVIRKMVRLWSNFAKTRNPTPSDDDDVLKNFKWQPIDKESDDTNYLRITKKLEMKTNPLGERATFWDEFLTKYKRQAIDGLVQNREDVIARKIDEL